VKNEDLTPYVFPFHHRDLFSEHGKFDETFRIVGDYEFLMRELKHGQASFAKDIITVGFQDGGLTNSANTLRPALQELSRLRRKHNISGNIITRPSKVRIKMLLAFLLYSVVGEAGFSRVQRLYRYIRGAR